MTMILDGKTLSGKILSNLKNEVEELKKRGINPKLSLILVGEDPASKSYVRLKSRRAKRIGIQSEIHKLPESIGEDELIKLIEKLNEDNSVHGVVVQMPLPPHINAKKVIEKLDPSKDVDGLHPLNFGRLLLGEECLVSPAVEGIVALMKEYNIDVYGKHTVILGATELTGKPAALMLMNMGSDVTICHSNSPRISEVAKQADILIVDIVKPKAINSSMVKEGVVVFDCGFNYVEGKLVGDVDFESVSKIASAITPVPGGVGPMIIAMLMRNLVKTIKLNFI